MRYGQDSSVSILGGYEPVPCVEPRMESVGDIFGTPRVAAMPWSLRLQTLDENGGAGLVSLLDSGPSRSATISRGLIVVVAVYKNSQRAVSTINIIWSMVMCVGGWIESRSSACFRL